MNLVVLIARIFLGKMSTHVKSTFRCAASSSENTIINKMKKLLRKAGKLNEKLVNGEIIEENYTVQLLKNLSI